MTRRAPRRCGRIDRDTAAAFLAAAAAQPARTRQALTDAIRAAPPVTHDALVKGIAGVVRYAAAQQAVLDAAATRLTQALEDGLEDEGPAGPADSCSSRR